MAKPGHQFSVGRAGGGGHGAADVPQVVEVDAGSVGSGLVITDQGKGSFVRSQAQLIRLGDDRYSLRHRDIGLPPFLLECARQGKTGRFEV